MALQTDAEEHLRYIRDVMQRSTEFSAISGVGVMAIGIVGIAASAYAAFALEPSAEWMLFWCAVAAVALLVGVPPTVRKARSAGTSVAVGPGRKFALCVAPAIVAGAGITFGLYQHDLFDLMPAAWLMIYGAGLTAGGTYSIGNLHVFGGLFILIGIAALLLPIPGDILMGVGFGVFHLVMGSTIYRRYGG
jgi:hypothetical protein